MLADKAHSKFLIRGSALLIGFSLIWWFLLLNPLQSVLRISVEFSEAVFFGGNGHTKVSESDSGDWSFDIRRQFPIPNPAAESGFTYEPRSITINVNRSDLNFFTFSLPVFWAILLTPPGIRKIYRPMILGTAIMLAVETALVLAFAEIWARYAIVQSLGEPGKWWEWFFSFGYNLVIDVLPCSAPFAVALILRPELRRQIMGRNDSENRWNGDSGEADCRHAR